MKSDNNKKCQDQSPETSNLILCHCSNLFSRLPGTTRRAREREKERTWRLTKIKKTKRREKTLVRARCKREQHALEEKEPQRSRKLSSARRRPARSNSSAVARGAQKNEEEGKVQREREKRLQEAQRERARRRKRGEVSKGDGWRARRGKGEAGETERDDFARAGERESEVRGESERGKRASSSFSSSYRRRRYLLCARGARKTKERNDTSERREVEWERRQRDLFHPASARRERTGSREGYRGRSSRRKREKKVTWDRGDRGSCGKMTMQEIRGKEWT